MQSAAQLAASTSEVSVPDGSNSLVPVQNGTEISLLDTLVERYRMFAKKSAEYSLELAETIFIADSELSPSDLEKFCERVGLDRRGSDYRKWRRTGRERVVSNHS
jgi:hypothetical protein